LLTQRQSTASRAVIVGVGPVGVEAIGDVFGQLSQLFGAKVAARVDQVSLDGLPGDGIDPAGEPLEEPADHRDLPATQLSLALGGGGGRQDGCQRFAGQPVPGA
jgi:hypothetical protein